MTKRGVFVQALVTKIGAIYWEEGFLVPVIYCDEIKISLEIGIKCYNHSDKDAYG